MRKDRTITARLVSAITGPNAVIPFAIESLLAWLLAIGCLTVSGYHYLAATAIRPTLSFVLEPTATSVFQSNGKRLSQDTLFWPCWIPLMTHSRAELDAACPSEIFQQAEGLLKEVRTSSVDDALLVRQIRENATLRRYVSLAMRPSRTFHPKAASERYQQYVRIWPALLELPVTVKAGTKSILPDGVFEISVIVPCFRERGVDVRAKLEFALQAAVNLKRIQLVLVDAGGCRDLARAVDQTGVANAWGSVRIVTFTEGTGRGPCLNFGARHADGQILAFLHSDTRLPEAWDARILATLAGDGASGVRTNACAFGFGIDTSATGLNGRMYPPGIRAVETTANLRCRLWSLPYGDQCLCLPTNVFHYLGGFPHQCIMEDYELVGLLRQRAALLPRWKLAREALRIIPGSPALCSPRRWQSYGVLYVTWMNSKLVHLYAGGVSPDEIYQRYYGQSLPSASA